MRGWAFVFGFGDGGGGVAEVLQKGKKIRFNFLHTSS